MLLRRLRIRYLIYLVFWPLGYALSWFTAYYPEYVEKYYALGFSRLMSRMLSNLTGIIPFSIAEAIMWLISITFIIKLLGVLMRKISERQLLANKNKEGLLSLVYQALVFLGIVYFCFMLIWGLNYNRLAFAEIGGLQVENVTEEELVELCDKLIASANHLRPTLEEDQKGAMRIKGGFDSITQTAVTAYSMAETIYPELAGDYGRPKPVFFSKLMSYTGISGIYFPFTSEANVNVDIPASMLPVTTCHEMAHQRGFAREDESNYIAWVACNSSDDPKFKYSGTLLALIHSLNALYGSNLEKSRILQAQYSDGVKRDLQDLSDYWEKYEGKVEEVTSEINDTYLKSNGQEEGVKSYGRMVDLLIAEQKADPRKKFLP